MLTNPANIAVVVGLLITVRIIYRELKERVVRSRTLWIRPAILAAITIGLAGLSLSVAPERATLLALSTLGGIVLGTAVGALLLRETAMLPGEPGTLQVKSSRTALVLWVALVAVRIGARFVLPSTPLLGLDLNVASLASVAAAFGVLAVGFLRAIRRTGALVSA